MSSKQDRDYIARTIVPELLQRFDAWSVEYQQERDLGIRGEFVGLYRKVRKLKTVLWDGKSAASWREGLRTILFEVAAHALLMLVDLDKEDSLDPSANESEGERIKT